MSSLLSVIRVEVYVLDLLVMATPMLEDTLSMVHSVEPL